MLTLATTRVEAGDMVIVMVLSLELTAAIHHGPLHLGNNNNCTQPDNHEVGLYRHGICIRSCFPPFSGHTLSGNLKQPSILGKCSQEYAVTTLSHTSTNIGAVMHTLSLYAPNNQWYMDIGATYHTTTSQGNLSSYSPLSILNKKVIVGSSGHKIPIH